MFVWSSCFCFWQSFFCFWTGCWFQTSLNRQFWRKLSKNLAKIILHTIFFHFLSYNCVSLSYDNLSWDKQKNVMKIIKNGHQIWSPKVIKVVKHTLYVTLLHITILVTKKLRGTNQRNSVKLQSPFICWLGYWQRNAQMQGNKQYWCGWGGYEFTQKIFFDVVRQSCKGKCAGRCSNCTTIPEKGKWSKLNS